MSEKSQGKGILRWMISGNPGKTVSVNPVANGYCCICLESGKHKATKGEGWAPPLRHCAQDILIPIISVINGFSKTSLLEYIILGLLTRYAQMSLLICYCRVRIYSLQN